MPFEPLTAVSSVDGRYQSISADLSKQFSEYGLIRKRLVVECEYLIALSKEKGVGPVKGETPHGAGMRKLNDDEVQRLRQLPDVSVEEAKEVKEIEKTTNHDVKAVEYYIKKKLQGTSLEDIAEWTHFALTSEDINSVAYGFALRSALQHVVIPELTTIQKTLEGMAREYAGVAMLSRTHGQSASPTTFGKEIRVFEQRLARQIQQLRERAILVKFGGATGGYNAHTVALPDVEWQKFSKKFIEGLNAGYEIHLELNPTTTQIEPHDTYAELSDNMRRINVILTDLSQDMWRYISDGWLTQKPKEGEVGSSAMPHKVNPIDFENAEGNFGIGNALFTHFSQKLPISRLQRDLSDSTVLRAFGTAFAHSLIAYRSLAKGLGKINVNEEAMREALEAHPEVISEAIQTVLRKEGVEVPYEKLKSLTRGKKVSLDDFARFIDGLDIKADVKERLKALRPESYIGLSRDIANG